MDTSRGRDAICRLTHDVYEIARNRLERRQSLLLLGTRNEAKYADLDDQFVFGCSTLRPAYS